MLPTLSLRMSELMAPDAARRGANVAYPMQGTEPYEYSTDDAVRPQSYGAPDASGKRPRTEPEAMKTTRSTTSGMARLREIIQLLRHEPSTEQLRRAAAGVTPDMLADADAEGMYVALWRAAFIASMQRKEEQYERAAKRSRAKLETETDRINEYERSARMDIEQMDEGAYSKLHENPPSTRGMGGGIDFDPTLANTWEIVEKVRETYALELANAERFEGIKKDANAKAEAMSVATPTARIRIPVWTKQRDGLVRALVVFVCQYPLQKKLAESLAMLIDSFVYSQSADAGSLTFMITGAAGTGKTTLARVLGNILSLLGVLVYSTVMSTTRADFIAEYEGQTPAKSRRLLMSNLERVVFLDEAYALTQYESNATSKMRNLTSVSAEAVAELLAFLSDNVGSAGFVAAGYERDMYCDFLTANEGLSRRFAYKVHIDDYGPKALLDIFYSQLKGLLMSVKHLKPLQSDDTEMGVPKDVRSVFSLAARIFLYRCVVEACKVREDPPDGMSSVDLDPEQNAAWLEAAVRWEETHRKGEAFRRANARFLDDAADVDMREDVSAARDVRKWKQTLEERLALNPSTEEDDTKTNEGNKKCKARYPLTRYVHSDVHQLFKDQAGSMALLAETVQKSILSSQHQFKFFTRVEGRPQRHVSMVDIYHLLRAHAMETLGDNRGAAAMRQLEAVASPWFYRLDNDLTMRVPDKFGKDLRNEHIENFNDDRSVACPQYAAISVNALQNFTAEIEASILGTDDAASQIQSDTLSAMDDDPMSESPNATENSSTYESEYNDSSYSYASSREPPPPRHAREPPRRSARNAGAPQWLRA